MARSRIAHAGARPWIVYRASRVLKWFLTNENYRNAMLVRLVQPRNLFQPDNYTEPDRYPRLFALARRELGNGPEKRILSFGCSTGEEVFSLRRYFADAKIEGVDINPHNITVCRRVLASNPDPGLNFAVVSSPTSLGSERYDAIFCMAVFRHGALGDQVWERCDKFIRFAAFDATTAQLARSLKVGGLLFIENSHFRFRDTGAFVDFEVVGEGVVDESLVREPTYDRDNRLISGETSREVAFRRLR
jgi:2-polyprenyl-3-methyl-5-hydroxy-6-metoxy-1,4-benzoquinol methylase